MTNTTASAFLLTAAICTYNRADLLRLSLGSLCKQTASPADFEILIVDNNSKDNTADVVCEFQQNFPHLAIRYVREEKQGLSHARNRVLQEARGAYFGFLDDDGQANPNWVATALEIIRTNPADIFGGPFYPFYLVKKPDWFLDEWGSSTFGQEPRTLNPDEYLPGGNCFYNKSLLENYGGFDATYGMTGNAIGYGEETELQNRLQALKPDLRVFYHPGLSMTHLVAEAKMHLGWQLRAGFQSGLSLFRLRHAGQTFRLSLKALLLLAYNVPVYTLRVFFTLTLGALLRDRTRYPLIQTHWYDAGWAAMFALGQQWALLRAYLGGRKK